MSNVITNQGVVAMLDKLSAAEGVSMTYSETPNPPLEPVEGDVWWDSENGISYRWIGGKWVQLRFPAQVE